MEGELQSNSNSREGFVKRIRAKTRFQAVVKKIGMRLKKSLQDSEDGVLRSQPLVLNVTLPEDLVELIVAMMPFPYLFRARGLSKSWRARFEPIPSLDDEVEKRLAISFQKKVTERSASWKSFCPVFIDWEEGLLAFDQESQNWTRLRSFLPNDLPNLGRLMPWPHSDKGVRAFENERVVTREQLDGAVLLFSTFHPLGDFWERRERKLRVANLLAWSWRHLRPDPAIPPHWPRNWPFDWRKQAKVHKLTVANLLTRRWKQLPNNPFTKSVYFFETFEYLFEKIVQSQTSVGTYKVIVFYRGAREDLVHIYNSKSDAWTSKTFVKHNVSRVQHPVYLNGVLYMACWYPGNRILAFHVEEETFEEIEILGELMERFVVYLVACNGNLLMVVPGQARMPGNADGAWQLLKLDLEVRQSWEVAQFPPRTCRAWVSHLERLPFGSDRNWICFPWSERTHGMMVYNLHEDEWRFTPFPHNSSRHLLFAEYQTSFVFQPNLNPFIAV